MKTHDITPSTNITMDWKRTGYDYEQAIFEIVDNALDAIRQRYDDTQFSEGMIHVDWSYDGDYLVISDNGCGMTEEELPSALCAGESSKSSHTLTGVFGVGLKKASVSLASSLEIISRTSRSEPFKSCVFDPSRITQTGTWSVQTRVTDEATLDEMSVYLPAASGTVILLRGLEKNVMPFHGNKASSIKSFRTKMSSLFRVGLRHIAHEGSQLGCYLPFSLKLQTKLIDFGSDPKTLFDPLDCDTGVHDTNFFLGGPNGEFEQVATPDGDYQCLIRCSHTKEVKSKITRGNLGAGIHGPYKRGVRWIRSGREICLDRNSELLNSKDLADFYVEISFQDSGKSSGPYQVDSAKKSLTVSPEALEFLQSLLAPYIKVAKPRSEEKKVSASSEEKQDLVCKGLTVSHKTERRESDNKKVVDIRSKKEVSEKLKRSNKRYVGHSSGQTTIQTENKFGHKSDFNFKIVEDPYSPMAFRESDPDEENPHQTVITLNKAHSWVDFSIRRNEDLQMYMTAGAWILANRDNSEEEIADSLLKYSNELAALTDALQKVEDVIKNIEKSA